MGVGRNLRKIGHFLEEFEGGAGTVNTVEFVERVDSNTGPTADIELTLSPSPDQGEAGFAPADVTIGADGRLQLELETTTPIVSATDHDLEIEPAEATVEADGTIAVSLRASVDDGAGSSSVRENDPASSSHDDPEELDGTTGERDRGVPPFRDPELLADVYDSCETFREMSEAIDMDVTAETVRRYMIDYGIHEPNSYDTDDGKDDRSDAGAETDEDDAPSPTVTDEDRSSEPQPGADGDQPSPVVLTDGIGLPDEVTVDALVETISRSNTIYEVRKDVGLDRDETLDLLRQLDLVDIVVGRVSTEHERDIGREEVLDRLRTAATTQP